MDVPARASQLRARSVSPALAGVPEVGAGEAVPTADTAAATVPPEVQRSGAVSGCRVQSDQVDATHQKETGRVAGVGEGVGLCEWVTEGEGVASSL